MIPLLVNILIILIVVGLLYWIVTQLPLPPPVKQIATVVVVVICVLWLVYLLLPLAGTAPHLQIR